MKKNKSLLFVLGLLLLTGCKSAKPLFEEQPQALSTPIGAKSNKMSFEKRMTLDALLFDALKFSIAENYEKATELYLQVLSLDSDNDVACYQLSRIYIATNKLSNAMVFIEKACRLDTKNEWYLLAAANVYSRTNQFQKIVLVYQKLIELFPEQLDYAYELANTYVRLNDFDKAIGVYDELENKFGVSDVWGMQKYKLYSFKKNDKKAEAELFKLVKTYPLEIKYLEILATMASEQQHYDKTFEYYQKVLAIDPLNPYIYLNLVDYYIKVEKPDSAFSYLGKAMLNPSLDLKTKIQFLQVYYAGQAKLTPNIIGQANVIFMNLIQAYPNEPRLNREYARFLYMSTDYENSRSELLKYMAVDSSDFATWGLLLNIADQLNDTTAIISYFERAVTIFPEQKSIYFLPIYYMQLRGEYQKVTKYAQKALYYVLSEEKDIILHLNIILAEAFFQEKNYEACIKSCKVAMDLTPDDLGLMNNYAYYLSIANINLEEAEKMGKKICQKEPYNYTYLDTYAWVLYQQGEYKDAVAILERAVSLSNSKEAVLLDHYGDALFKNGDEIKALQYWKMAIELTAVGSEEFELLTQKIATQKLVENK